MIQWLTKLIGIGMCYHPSIDMELNTSPFGSNSIKNVIQSEIVLTIIKIPPLFQTYQTYSRNVYT